MMSRDTKKKQEGAVILENYKKQLQDKMAREKAARIELREQGLDPRASQLSLQEFMDQRIAAFDRTAVPDPKDLEDILSGL